jgi:hypothetical protein
MSPYSYTGGNPLNAVDPDGALTPETWGLIIALTLVLLSAVATGVQAGLNGASANQASAAGIISLGTGLATLVVGGFLGAFVGPTAAPATAGSVTAAAQGTTHGAGLAIAGAVTAIGGSTYSAVTAFQNGQYAIGAFAIVAAVAALYGGYRALKGLGSPELAQNTTQTSSMGNNHDTYPVERACDAGHAASCGRLQSINEADLAEGIAYYKKSRPELMSRLPDPLEIHWKHSTPDNNNYTDVWTGEVHLSRAYASKRLFMETLGHEFRHAGDPLGIRLFTWAEDMLNPVPPHNVGPYHSSIYRYGEGLGNEWAISGH